MTFRRVPRRVSTLLLASAMAAMPLAHPAVSRAAEEAHVVQPGETISTIAGALGVDPDALVTANGLQDPNQLAVGQVLKMPPGPPRSHQVQEGETLSIIASMYGLSVDSLLAANQLVNPDQLELGLTLRLPVSGGSVAIGATARPAPATPVAAGASPSPTARPIARPGASVPYVVSAGDTLFLIAQRFETSVDALLAANGLPDPNRLSLGQIIQVPAKSHLHTVGEGETLATIASLYSVDLGSIVDFNKGISDPDLIRVGDTVEVPRVAPANSTSPVTVSPAGNAVAALTPTPAPAVATTTTPPAPPAGLTSPTPELAASQANAAPTPAPTAAPKLPTPQPVATVEGSGGMAAVAMRLLGRPYVWGGSDESGFDCSGFVWYVAKRSGVSISRGLTGQFEAGAHPERDELRPGDIVFFQNTYMPGLSHNGIYIGEGKFVHAADEASGVAVSRLDDAYWASRYFGATRP